MRTYAPLTNDTKGRIEGLLAERISLEGICRVEGISPHQLYRYLDELCSEIPSDLTCSVSEKAAIDLVKINCKLDELWSFVGWKANKQWVWVAIDRASQPVGPRTRHHDSWPFDLVKFGVRAQRFTRNHVGHRYKMGAFVGG